MTDYGESFTDKIHVIIETRKEQMITLCNPRGMGLWAHADQARVKKGPICKNCRRMLLNEGRP